MTTSGTNTFNLTRNEIIEQALGRIGVKTFSRNPTDAEIKQGAITLNCMIKSWKNDGINLWKSAQGTLFLDVGKNNYKLDGITANATEQYTFSLLSSDALSGSNTIQVADPTQFTIGYFIGVMQGNNSSVWSTITNITGNIITLATNLTADSHAGSLVYCYQTKIRRPEGVSSARFRMNINNNINDGTEIPAVIYANKSYFDIVLKNTESIVNAVYYDKQLDYGSIYTWPTPAVNTYVLKFTFQKQFDDFDIATNTPDFPPEWLKALYLNLAYDLAPFYGKTPDESLKRDAAEALARANSYDQENVSFRITPFNSNNMSTYG